MTFKYDISENYHKNTYRILPHFKIKIQVILFIFPVYIKNITDFIFIS